MDCQEEEVNSMSYNNQEINTDFRLLLTHSRYDQIERELLKMFDERHLNRNLKNRHGCTHHHNHSLERSLFDIEEDLHKILLLLVKQLEMLSMNNNKNNNKDIKMEIQTPVKVEMETIPESSAKTISKFEKSKHSQQANHTNNSPPSEYSKLCMESDERFRNKLNRIHQVAKSPTIHSLHYRLTKPDIDLVLGNETLGQSHSKFVAKQYQLARFKQHNLLCSKINELHNQHQKLSIHHQQTPHQIIKQIQSLIDELHLEHDWISK
ncbi:hypothetical protein BLA29_006801 [Euroglyphus maynei]|uniref:Uncharacterized protein n=1 Tax=Euroglyphus maynei TaxID=6958 RepID=A0A1Y3B2M8_EURMA|nr:hypothetical protein BLA29_006801 [Euroglyphus maynei]